MSAYSKEYFPLPQQLQKIYPLWFCWHYLAITIIAEQIPPSVNFILSVKDHTLIYICYVDNSLLFVVILSLSSVIELP